MAIPTPKTANTVIEIDERGRGRVFVDGIPIVGVTSVETSYPARESGEIVIRINSRCVGYKMVKTSAVEPTGEII